MQPHGHYHTQVKDVRLQLQQNPVVNLQHMQCTYEHFTEQAMSANKSTQRSRSPRCVNIYKKHLYRRLVPQRIEEWSMQDWNILHINGCNLTLHSASSAAVILAYILFLMHGCGLQFLENLRRVR